MAIDYSALLGISAGLQVAKADYDFARDGGAVGIHNINSPALPIGAMPVGTVALTTIALTFDGAGSLDTEVDGQPLGSPSVTLGRIAILWPTEYLATVLTAERPVTVEVFDFAVLTGAFTVWVFYLPTS